MRVLAPPQIKDDAVLCQELAAMYHHCAGLYGDNPKGWLRSRSWASHFYAKARALMGVNSDDRSC